MLTVADTRSKRPTAKVRPKRLRSGNLEKFNQEPSSLRIFQDQDDKHIIKLLTTFEVRETQFGMEASTTTYTSSSHKPTATSRRFGLNMHLRANGC